MSVEENKALIRCIYDLLNRKEFDAYFALIDSDCVFHNYNGDFHKEQTKQIDIDWYSAFPDLHNTIEEMVAEGDRVCVRVNYQGTHIGKGYGWTPTGKKINITNANTIMIANGKLVEIWNVVDVCLFKQLGINP
jgi:C-1 hydroxylase